MPAATMRSPFNLNAWIKENLPKPLGGIGNKDVFEEDTDMIFQIVKGPNGRNDFHICPSDEFFYQLQGDMTLAYLDEHDPATRRTNPRRRRISLAPLRAPFASAPRGHYRISHRAAAQSPRA
jgi:3-hydroxyanthranilate 3,4-dioxygenase